MVGIEIHLCTCIEGSASSPGLNRKRAARTSCKTCGGKQLINGRGSPPGSMLSTVGLELTSLMNSDLTWKKASKGRTASRRARKPVARCSKAGGEFVNKELKRVTMPISESEKLGVSVLGCRFSEKAEHMPIKKRRFFFRSSSPPSKNSFLPSEETERPINSQHASGLDFPSDLMARCQLMATDAAAASLTDLSKIVDTELDCDGKNLFNGFPGANEDFSGISILAAAACSTSRDGFERVSQDGESSAHERPLEVLLKNESFSLSKGFSMEDLVSSAKISTEEAASCTSPVPEKELAATLRTENSLPKGQTHGLNVEGSSLPDSSLIVSQDLLRSKDDETTRTHESSVRDDRSHWDLNTAMDSWECPFEYQSCDSQFNVGDSICEDVDDGKHVDEMEKSKGCELQGESGGTNGKIQLPSDSSRLAQAQDLNIEEQGFDSGSGINGSICVQETLIFSSEIINASKTDLPQEMESLHNEERIGSDTGSVVSVPVEHDQGLSVRANVDENAPVEGVAFASTGTDDSLCSLQVSSLDSRADNSLHLNCNNLKSICISEGNGLAISTGIAIANDMNDCVAKTPKDSTISSSSEGERLEAATSLVDFSEKSTYDSMDVLKEDAEDRKLSISEGVHVHKAMISFEMGKVQTVGDISENAICKSFSQSSPTCAEMPRPEGFLGGQPVVAVDAKEQHGQVSLVGADDTQVHIDSRELTKCSGKSAELLGASSGFSGHGECTSASNELVDHPDKIAGSGYDSDVSQDDLGPAVRIEKAIELQMDDDSQFEDGELRESIEYTWEDLGGKDGEGEHVDYVSDNRDMASFSASDYHVMLVKVEGAECRRQGVSNTKNLGSEPEQSCLGSSLMTKVVEAVAGKEDGVKCRSPCLSTRLSGKDDVDEHAASSAVNKELGAGPDNVSGDHEMHVKEAESKEASQQNEMKMKISGRDLLPGNGKSSSATATELRDGSGWKKISGDTADGLSTEDDETRMVKSRTFKRELLSRIEGPVSGDVFLGKHRLCTQGSRSNDAGDSNSRSGRESDSVKSFRRGGYSLHIHSRGCGSEHWADYPDGHRALRRHHSSGYRSITGFSFPGPENTAALFTRRHTNVPSHGLRQAFKRSGSPPEGDEAFGMRLGLRPAGEISPDRRVGIVRERSLRYGPRVDDRGLRGRYDGNVLDGCIESSLNYPHPLAKRERSFSPIGRKGDPSVRQSHTKSPSRSRSCSPNTWQSPKGRNGTGVAGNPCLRHRSRSPSSRSGVRVQRVRSPHQRSSFASDHMVGFMSMPRHHGSPPHNSRWIGNKKDVVVHFREHGYKQRSSVLDRRSPGRICPRGERSDLVDSRKPKPNEYYRSMHPGRFSEMDGVARGPRYEGSDDDRKKHGCRYRMVQPGRRRNDMDGAVKRFRYDIEDGFVAAHNYRKKDGSDFHSRSPKDYTRVIDSRFGDIPRRSREERGPFLCRRDDGDEDLAPRKRRPL